MLSASKILSEMKVDVIDKDSLSIIKTMVKHSEEYDTNKVKMNKVLEEMNFFHCLLERKKNIHPFYKRDNEKNLYHGESILTEMFYHYTNTHGPLDYGFADFERIIKD